MRCSDFVLLLLAILVVAYGHNLDMSSTADLQQATQLAEEAKNNGVWFVRVFAANNTDSTVKGPFSSAGLHPVKGNTVQSQVNTAATIKSILTTGNPNPPNALLTTGPLVATKILPAAIPNPLAEIDYKAPIAPIAAEDLKRLKPAVVLGVPDKRVNPEAYKEWKKVQEPFGYLGLDKVVPTKVLGVPVTVTTKRNRTHVFNPVTVVTDKKAYNTVVGTVSNSTGLSIPVLMDNVVPHETIPSLDVNILPRVLDFYHPVIGTNAPAPVPGAVAAPVFPAPSFLEVDSDRFTPATMETEEGVLQAQSEAWDAVTDGVHDLANENLDYHSTSAAQVNQMASDVARALGVSPVMLSVSEEVDTTEDVDGELEAHHEVAAEEGIDKQFKFVRASGVLGRSIDVTDAEQDQLSNKLEDHLSFLESALESAEHVDAEQEEEQEEEATEENKEEATEETEEAADANSPVVQYYRRRLTRLGFPVTPALSHYVWKRIHALPRRYVTINGQYINPHPMAVRIIARRLAAARDRMRSYRIARAHKIRKLAYRTQKFLNKLARASLSERRLVARALAVRPQDYKRARRQSLRSLIKKYKKQASTVAKKEASAAKKEVAKAATPAAKVATPKVSFLEIGEEAVVDESDKLLDEIDSGLAEDVAAESELDAESENISDIVHLATHALNEEAQPEMSKEKQQLSQLTTIPTFRGEAGQRAAAGEPTTRLSQLASLM